MYEFSKPSSCSKYICSLKWITRGSLLLQATDMNAEAAEAFIRERARMSHGFGAMAQLCLIHNCLSTFERVVRNKIELGIREGDLKLNGIDLGTAVWKTALDKARKKMSEFFKKITFGLELDNLGNDFDQVLGKSSPPGLCDNKRTWMGYCLGVTPEFAGKPPTEQSSYEQSIMKQSPLWSKLLNKFFQRGANGQLEAKNMRDVKVWLSDCLAFEENALCLVHILTGNSARATKEYESLYMRNISSDGRAIANVYLYDKEWVMIDGTSWKTALLQETNNTKTVMIRREYIETLLLYWTVVRPAGAGLLKLYLGSVDPYLRTRKTPCLVNEKMAPSPLQYHMWQ